MLQDITKITGIQTLYIRKPRLWTKFPRMKRKRWTVDKDRVCIREGKLSDKLYHK